MLCMLCGVIPEPAGWRDANRCWSRLPYRRTVDANELLQQSNKVVLGLGVVSGSDQTWINGHQIGSTGSWGAPSSTDYEAWRRYLIIPGLLKPTGNVVAIRVFTEGGNGTYMQTEPLLGISMTTLGSKMLTCAQVLLMLRCF